MIYVTGYNGRLGSYLVSLGCRPLEIDLTKVPEKLTLSSDNDVIINCAAKTKVDACADDEYYKQAIETNGYGIGMLAKAYPGKILHISTDYVFQGRCGPYSEDYDFYDNEDDLPTKQMSYGITKLVGELEVRRQDNVHIIRTTGLYGGLLGKGDFVDMVLDAFKSKSYPIKVTSELMGNQTYIPHLANALLECAKRNDIPKVLHTASREIISRYGFALLIADQFGLDKSNIVPVSNSEVPRWIEARPTKGGLNVDLAVSLGIPIYSISEGLRERWNSDSSI